MSESVNTAIDMVKVELEMTAIFLRALAKHLVANEMDGQAGNCTLRADACTRALTALDFVSNKIR